MRQRNIAAVLGLMGSIACADPGGASTDTSVPALASDIALEFVCANQGVEACLFGAEGAPVAPADRAVPLIAGRPMLVRVGWRTTPVFEARDLAAALTLVHRDGTTEELEDVRFVEGPADRTTLEGTFTWLLDAAQVTPGLALSVQVVEADDQPRGDPWVPRLPESGAASLELVEDRMVIDYTVVPLSNPCGDAPVLDDQDRADLEAFLFNVFPITALNITYHEPVFVDECERERAMEVVRELRASEKAPASAYYQGLFLDDTGMDYGYATRAGPALGADRVSYATWWRHSPGDKWGGIDNAAHELAHNHGLAHPWDDPDTDGVRTEYGYGLRSGRHPDWDVGDMQRLYPPVSSEAEPVFGDMLSYDFPYWVSAYSYGKLVERVRTVSAFPEE